MNRIQMKENAKRAIKGRVFISFLVILFVTVLASLPSALNGAGRKLYIFSGLFSIVVAVALLPMQNGVVLYFYNISNGLKENFGDIIKPYKNGAFEELIKAKLLSGLYIILGLICLVVPGIYLAFKYAMIDYIFAENPKISYKEAMRTSADIMQGRKLDLFILALSFIGWFILSALTFGILLIYVLPYVQATFVQFYLSSRKTFPEPEIEFIRPEDNRGGGI